MSERIAPPNYTQMPNQVLDAMPSLSCAETKVVLAVCRKTFGWHKETALLSLTYLEKMTGLSRQGVVNGLDSLLKRGWLSRTESGQSFEYEVLIESPVNENDQSTELTSQQSCKEVGNGVDTLKKGKKLSKLSKAKGTLDEVKAFCETVQISAADAEWFFYKCEGNDWTNSGKLIKNWQATLRAWKAGGYLPSQKNGGGNLPPGIVRGQRPPPVSAAGGWKKDDFRKRIAG